MRSFFRALAISGLALLGWSAMVIPMVAHAADVAPRAEPSDAPAPRTALGMIVKLKGVDREMAVAASVQLSQQMAQQRAWRLGRLAKLAGYPSTMPWVPTGRAMQHMKLPTPLTREQAAALASKMLASGEVEWAEPNVLQKLQQASPVPNPSGGRPNDGLINTGDQWWIENATNTGNPPAAGLPNVLAAWAKHRGATSGQTVVAVLDTGVLTAGAVELSGRVLPGYDFVSETVYDRDSQPGRDADASDPGDWLTQSQKNAQPLFSDCKVQDSKWHGTKVASILGAVANNGVDLAGMHWDARILPVRVAGICGAYLADILDAMRWAGGLPVQSAPVNTTPAKIINISFGGDGACGAAYQDAINELRNAGVLVVASAGNEQGAGVTRPANCAGVLAVAALGRAGLKTHYSGFGPQVSVATVGGDESTAGTWGAPLNDAGLPVLSNTSLTAPNTVNYPIVWDGGTSFAAPIVSGVAALMWELNPALTVDQVIDGIKLSARLHVTTAGRVPTCSSQNPGRCQCTTATCGAGILDALRALEYAQDPTLFVSTRLPPASAVSIDSLALQAAVALGPDAPPYVPKQTTPARSGGGGGGASDGPMLLALAMALAAGWGKRRFAPGRARRA